MLRLLTGKKMFNWWLERSASLARSSAFSGSVKPLMRMMAALNGRMRGLSRKDNVSDLAAEWQRMFPGSSKYFPVVSTEKDTAIAEIRVRCPLRDSGDPQACYLMMEYDRAMVSRMGGQFVVLSSQSDNGLGYCRVAMRMKGRDISDLEQAHMRKPSKGAEEA